MKSLFSPKEVRELVGVTYPQLKYWEKINFIASCAGRDNKGRKYRCYTFTQVVLIKIVSLLRQNRISIQKMHLPIQRLRKILFGMDCEIVECVFLFYSLGNFTVFTNNVRMSTELKDPVILFRFATLRDEIAQIFPEISGAKRHLLLTGCGDATRE